MTWLLTMVGPAWRWLTTTRCGRYLLAVLAVALVAQVSYCAGNSRGGAREASKCREREQRAMVNAQERYRTEEEFHAKEVRELQSRYASQQQTAAAVDARAVADLGSGVRRLRFPVARGCPSAAAPGGTPGRIDEAAPAEIAPEIARSLYSIAADGDEAIRQLTALQAWVRDALRLCGQQGGRL
jgi:hypothetical protein